MLEALELWRRRSPGALASACRKNVTGRYLKMDESQRQLTGFRTKSPWTDAIDNRTMSYAFELAPPPE
jgi:hypothetical protein